MSSVAQCKRTACQCCSPTRRESKTSAPEAASSASSTATPSAEKEECSSAPSSIRKLAAEAAPQAIMHSPANNARRIPALMKSARKNARRQITVATIADDGDNDGVFELFGHIQSDLHRAAGRNTRENAFFTRQPTRHFLRRRLADILETIHRAIVVNTRQIGLWPFSDTRNLRALFRLTTDDFDLRFLLFQKPRAPHDRAGRTHAADKMGDLSACLLPDFHPGAFIVRDWVVRVGELVENHAPPFVPHALSHVSRNFHAALFGGQHQFGTKSAHRLTALHALVFRHHQNDSVPTYRCGHGQRNASVPAGRLNECVTRLDLPTRFGAYDHRQCRSIFNRARRIVPLELGKDHVVAARIDTFQAHQRGTADIVFKSLVVHGCDQGCLRGKWARAHCALLVVEIKFFGTTRRIRLPSATRRTAPLKLARFETTSGATITRHPTRMLMHQLTYQFNVILLLAFGQAGGGVEKLLQPLQRRIDA